MLLSILIWPNGVRLAPLGLDWVSLVGSEKLCWHMTDNGLKARTVKAGILQDSPLGALLWNSMYDGVFGLHVPEETALIISLIDADDFSATGFRLNW